MGLLCQHILTASESVQQNLNSARRRVPREFLAVTSPNEAHLGLSRDWYEQIVTCYSHASKLMRTLQDLSKSAIQTILTSGGMKQAGTVVVRFFEILRTSSRLREIN